MKQDGHICRRVIGTAAGKYCFIEEVLPHPGPNFLLCDWAEPGKLYGSRNSKTSQQPTRGDNLELDPQDISEVDFLFRFHYYYIV